MKLQVLLRQKTYHPALQSANAFTAEPPTIARHSGSSGQAGRETWLSAEAAGIIDEVRHALERDPEGARAVALRLVTFLSRSVGTESVATQGGLAPWMKRKVDDYLRGRLECPLCVKELARLVALSPSHFFRAFKQSYGRSPHAHIVRLRLELAQRLMLTTDEPLCQIALACGLADQAHLSKLFRREVGETPGAWRRRNLIDAQAEAGLNRIAVSSDIRNCPFGDSKNWPP